MIKSNFESSSYEKKYYVYMITNPGNTTLYICVSNNLFRRVLEHKEKLIEGFTKKYNLVKLGYFEEFGDIKEAISREKQIKGGSRKMKIDLITDLNPTWKDLYEE